MKRAALVCAVVTMLLFADGIYMEASHYQPGDQDPLFGDPRFIMSDGTTVLVAAGMLAVVTAVMWLAATRKRSSH